MLVWEQCWFGNAAGLGWKCYWLGWELCWFGVGSGTIRNWTLTHLPSLQQQGAHPMEYGTPPFGQDWDRTHQELGDNPPALPAPGEEAGTLPIPRQCNPPPFQAGSSKASRGGQHRLSLHSHSIHSSLKRINFPSGYLSSPFPTCQGEQDPLSRAWSWAFGDIFYLNHLLCSL